MTLYARQLSAKIQLHRAVHVPSRVGLSLLALDGLAPEQSGASTNHKALIDYSCTMVQIGTLKYIVLRNPAGTGSGLEGGSSSRSGPTPGGFWNRELQVQ